MENLTRADLARQCLMVVPPNPTALESLADAIAALKDAGFKVRMGISFNHTMVLQISPVDMDEHNEPILGRYRLVSASEYDNLVRAPRYAKNHKQ